MQIHLEFQLYDYWFRIAERDDVADVVAKSLGRVLGDCATSVEVQLSGDNDTTCTAVCDVDIADYQRQLWAIERLNRHVTGYYTDLEPKITVDDGPAAERAFAFPN